MLIQWHELSTDKGNSLSTPYIENAKGETLHHPFAITDDIIHASRGRISIKESTEWIQELPDKSIVKFFLLGKKIILIKENLHIDLNKIFIPLRLTSNDCNRIINEMQPDELININHAIYIYENFIYNLQDFKAFLQREDTEHHIDRLEHFLINKIQQVKPIIPNFESFQKKLKTLYHIKQRILRPGTEAEGKVALNMYRKHMTFISDTVLGYQQELESGKYHICNHCKSINTTEMHGGHQFFCNSCKRTFY